MGPTSREDLPQNEQVVMRRPRKPPWPGLDPEEDPPPGGWVPPPPPFPVPPPLPPPEPDPPPLPVRLLLAMFEVLAFPLAVLRARLEPRVHRA